MGNNPPKAKKGPRPPSTPAPPSANINAAKAAPPAVGGAQPDAKATDSQPTTRGETGAKMNKKLTVDDFELLKVVGKGSFGKVMQVKKKDTGKIYAMKVLKKQHLVARKQVAHTQTERRVLENIDHPFIVSLRFAFQTASKLYMVLDYFTGGELFFHLKNHGRFSEARAKFYAAEIVLALKCLHDHAIVYRDLKPENVLLDEGGHIRLTDFGLSKESVGVQQLTHTFCGTPEYLAPEVIHGTGYGPAVDWWSLGTLLYEMLTGLPPFYNQNLHVMYEKIIRARLTFPSHMSPEGKDLLTKLLDRNPATRLGSAQEDAREVMRHPFFADIDWEGLMNKTVEPPFKPTVTEGKMDVGNVDEEFKSEKPQDTPVQNSRLAAKVQFPDFTYQAPQSVMAASLLNSSEMED